MGYLVGIYKNTCMSSHFLSPNMHNHHLEIHSSEKLQDMFTSIISEISISLPLTSLRVWKSNDLNVPRVKWVGSRPLFSKNV